MGLGEDLWPFQIVWGHTVWDPVLGMSLWSVQVVLAPPKSPPRLQDPCELTGAVPVKRCSHPEVLPMDANL